MMTIHDKLVIMIFFIGLMQMDKYFMFAGRPTIFFVIRLSHFNDKGSLISNISIFIKPNQINYCNQR